MSAPGSDAARRNTFALYPPASPRSPAMTISLVPPPRGRMYGDFAHSGAAASCSVTFSSAPAYSLDRFMFRVARRILEEATSPIALVR